MAWTHQYLSWCISFCDKYHHFICYFISILSFNGLFNILFVGLVKDEDLLPQVWNGSCNAMWQNVIGPHLFSHKLQLLLRQHQVCQPKLYIPHLVSFERGIDTLEQVKNLYILGIKFFKCFNYVCLSTMNV